MYEFKYPNKHLVVVIIVFLIYFTAKCYCSSDSGERRVDRIGSGDEAAETIQPDHVGTTENEQVLDRGGGPFGFMRHFIPDPYERIFHPSDGDDYFRNLSDESNRDRVTSEKMDVDRDTDSLGGDDDYSGSDDDDTVQSHEEKYEDLIAELGRELAGKFVSGIHRYIISRVIVPSGAGGVPKCLRELDYLINKYALLHCRETWRPRPRQQYLWIRRRNLSVLLHRSKHILAPRRKTWTSSGYSRRRARSSRLPKHTEILICGRPTRPRSWRFRRECQII